MKAVAARQKISLPADVSIQADVAIGPMTGKEGAFCISVALAVTVPGMEKAATEALVAAAHSDPLTGLRNRRALDALVAVPVNAAVLMIDVDHFKRVNDEFGHSVGDVVLQRIADALTSSIRRTDTAIRYGGEEFVAVVQLEEDVPAATAAAEIAERVRDAVAEMDLSAIGIEQPITVSVGAAVIDGDESLHEHVRRADAALYTAKRDGRDRAVLFDQRLG